MTLLPPPTDRPNSLSTPPAPNGGMPGAPMAQSTASGFDGFDIWGPLQRRKYLIALFCLIGLGLGYLYYVKAPEEFSTSARLMITSKTPPSMIDGQTRRFKESLEKHASLIGSELVLDSASKDGSFNQLDMFADTPFPELQLRGMLKVIPETDETMVITCTGSNPDELATVLEQVVDSYVSVIQKDSRAVAQNDIDLIQRIASRLTNEKETADDKRFKLWNQLGIEQTDKDGYAINPLNRPLALLQDEYEKLNQQLDEIQDRNRMLTLNLTPDEETGFVDPIRMSIAAISARDYLKLSPAPFREEAIGGDRVVRNLSPEYASQRSLENKIWELGDRIENLKFTRAEYAVKYGSGHSKLSTIDSQLEYYGKQRQELRDELDKVNAVIEGESVVKTDDPNTVAPKRMDLATFRANEERDWVLKYRLKLQQEQMETQTKIERTKLQINEAAAKARQTGAGIAELNKLQSEVRQKDEAVRTMLEKVNDMNILNDHFTTTNVVVIDKPKRGRKVAPSLPKALGIGVVASFLLGLGLAILVDQSELAFRNPSEIFDRLQIPVVGRIPRINTRQIEAKLGHASLVAAHKPSATASESFRDVRTALFFRANLDGIKTILFTSPSPGDGKSTTIANLAISIAQAGKKVVLVDADFRRPRVHQYFGQDMNPGLMDVLNGVMSLKEAIQKAELQENLFLLPAGGRPRNPGELVTSEAFRNLIEALREKFDYVLIDSPPVLPVSDPATISSMVDGVYLVTRIRKGVKLTTQKAKETLDRVGANWMGVIVNGLDENPHYSEYGYQYGNYSYYGGMYGRYYDSTNKVYRDKINKS